MTGEGRYAIGVRVVYDSPKCSYRAFDIEYQACRDKMRLALDGCEHVSGNLKRGGFVLDGCVFYIVDPNPYDIFWELLWPTTYVSVMTCLASYNIATAVLIQQCVGSARHGDRTDRVYRERSVSFLNVTLRYEWSARLLNSVWHEQGWPLACLQFCSCFLHITQYELQVVYLCRCQSIDARIGVKSTMCQFPPSCCRKLFRGPDSITVLLGCFTAFTCVHMPFTQTRSCHSPTCWDQQLTWQ